MGDFLKWIDVFLKDRQQGGLVHGEDSTWKDVKSGVSQGSVLGPLLFVVFINTLPESVRYSDIFLYPDDMKIFRKIKEDEDCNKFQDDLNEMRKWSEE